MKSYKDLGNRYIKYRKKRAVLVTLSMVLATVFIYAVTTAVLNYWFDRKAVIEEHSNYHGEIPNLTMEQCEKIKNYSTVRNADFMSLDIEQSFVDFYGNERLEICYIEDVNQSTCNFKLLEGEYPQNNTEIILDKAYMHLFKDDIKVGSKVKTVKIKKITDEITERTTEQITEEYIYTVVGIYEYEHPDMYAYNFVAFSKATEDMTMTAYVRFDISADWNKYLETLAKDVGVDIQKPKSYIVNEGIEGFYFKGYGVSYIASFLMLMVFVVYCCMVMIRGLFTANLMDNITEFNILKAMGATDKKIKNIYKREIYLEGIAAFVLGGILTHLLFFVIVNTINVGEANFGFNPVALLFAFGFLYITITLAIIEPFAVLKKVPIVEGIRANYAINTIKEKKRNGKLFRIFGIEGEYAYKNIRRNSKSFWNGVATFTISVLILTVLATVLINIDSELKLEMGKGQVEDLYDYYTLTPADDKAHVDKAQDAFDRASFIKSADPIYYYWLNSEENTENIKLTEEAKKAIDEKKISSDELRVDILFYTESQLEKLNSYMMDGVDANVIRDGGAILVNNRVHYNMDGEKDLDIKLWDAEVGDCLNIDTVDYMVEWNEAMGDVETVKEFYSKEPPKDEIKLEGFCQRGLGFNNISLILSYDYYIEQYGQDLSFLCEGFFIDIDEDEFRITDMAKLETIIYEEAVQSEYVFLNMAKFMEEQTRPVKVIAICIVIFVILMGLVSILNNMINEYQVRRREVSILRAIGMSKKKLNRMLILERVVIGIIAWIIGTILGIVMSRMLLISILYSMETTMIVPWATYLLIGAGVVCIMVLISMIMVVSMGKKDITDGIRNQE